MMDKESELLLRSALHDMGNVLAGVQGIMDLADPAVPLPQRDRDRILAVVEEGLVMLGRVRHLGLGTLPDAQLQPGDEWRNQLLDELKSLGCLFRCRFEITLPDEGLGQDRWPGALLRSYLRAVSRQVLPYLEDGVLRIHCQTEASEWQVALSPVSQVPEALLRVPADKPGDVGGRWSVQIGTTLGIAISCEDGSLLLRIPKP